LRLSRISDPAYLFLSICSITKAHCKRRCERRDAPSAQIEARQSRGFSAKGKLRDKSNVIAASLETRSSQRRFYYIVRKIVTDSVMIGSEGNYKGRNMGINHRRGVLTYALVSGAVTRHHKNTLVSGAVTRHHKRMDSRLRGNDKKKRE